MSATDAFGANLSIRYDRLRQFAALLLAVSTLRLVPHNYKSLQRSNVKRKNPIGWCAGLLLRADRHAFSARQLRFGFLHAYQMLSAWYGMLQLNGQIKDRDRGSAAEPAESGGSFVWLSPGLSYAAVRRVRAYLRPTTALPACQRGSAHGIVDCITGNHDKFLAV
jgi:hypothetical protein